MPCSTCNANGNTLGCPCQEIPKDACAPTFTNAGRVYRDPCTGESKRTLPFVSAPAREEYDMKVIGVNLSPKKAECKDVLQPCQQRKCCKKDKVLTCYQCGEKRGDCYPADPKCYQLEYLDNFAKFKPGYEDDDVWNFFTNTNWKADDGAYKITQNGLHITCTKFRKSFTDSDDNNADQESEDTEQRGNSNAGFLDHFKYFVILNSEYKVPDCGELYAEACMSGRTYGTENHPFGDDVLNHLSDLRLGYAAFSMLDFESGLHISTALTNDSIYAIYEVLPFDSDDGMEETSGAAAFAFAHLIGRRNVQQPLSDYVRVGLALDKRKGAKWYINGVLKHSIERLGHLHDPAEALYQFPGKSADISLQSCVNVGFGLFTMMDAVQPLNHRDLRAAGTGLVRLTNFDYQHPWKPDEEVIFTENDSNSPSRMFGQGAALRIKELKIELRC